MQSLNFRKFEEGNSFSSLIYWGQ